MTRVEAHQLQGCRPIQFALGYGLVKRAEYYGTFFSEARTLWGCTFLGVDISIALQ
jgi:hypothetical protein